MKNNKFMTKTTWFFLIGFLLYLAFHLLTLTRFPFIHSDEPWLSGLSRNIWESGDFSVTETFFDLKPRYPHAIKIVFHTLQILFLNVFGYRIFTFRLISLLFGIGSLVLCYRIMVKLSKQPALSMGITLLLAMDIQFIYASHFARQEILLLFFLLSAFCLYLSYREQPDWKRLLLLSGILGLSIGLHPNSFVISSPFLLLFGYDIFVTKKITLYHGLVGGFVVSIFAAGFVGLSLSFDRDFFAHYFAYGKEFEVDAPFRSKLFGLIPFYQKLFYQISGTYFTLDIRFQLIVFLGALFLSIVSMVKSPGKRSTFCLLLLALLGLHLGMVIIGRYNPTSILFLLPFGYFLLGQLLIDLKSVPQKWILVGILGVLLLGTTTTVWHHTTDYQAYLDRLDASLSPQSTVLANLNSEYFFENGKLFDYRNLAYLNSQGLTFEEYIRTNRIEYIVLPEEMDFIYENRPKWNGLYGNPSYYEEMRDFAENNCQLVDTFDATVYGMRIVRYNRDRPWQVRVYRVKPEL